MNTAGANAITTIATTRRIETPPCPRVGRVADVVRGVELPFVVEPVPECPEPAWQHRV
jgi:hypothetical protein